MASAKKILWNSLLRKPMANSNERIDALEAQIRDMIKRAPNTPGILKQFSLRLDALGVNLEATDNALYAENMEWKDSRAVVNTPTGGGKHSSRPRVLEPKSYEGARDAKEVENFLFDIEQYFRVIRVDSEATKVSAMYLVADAKLWWRKKYAEIEDGSCIINTWDILKRELKSQFFPENTAFNARKALLECKHTGSVREYCQAFSALMLDISNMSAVDKLFFFMEGLKPWARTELNRRRVKRLPRAFQITTPSNRDPLREEIQAEMNAFFDNIGQVQRGEQSGSQSRHPPTDEQTDVQDYEEEDVVGAFPQWCNAMTTQSFEVHTDASDFALGGILMQECHPVAYESRKLKEAEHCYTIHEKELLAVVHCLIIWRFYLLGSSFIVRTNNTAVSHFLSQFKFTSKQARWQELLAEFNFMLEYRAGSTNSVADALNRRAELD
ncbi:hypothetical protein RJ639_000111 [Escallonia herrerae]|uniref:Reverse transcriptase RNase H-like domain-containing protein n=1 Tax=Escallonia herrerae TaxID=1293975 RepID=A0AA89BIK7_9ASTE|nr:hypothetical protein RJ639_000111 [Escallonia herrerae]